WVRCPITCAGRKGILTTITLPRRVQPASGICTPPTPGGRTFRGPIPNTFTALPQRTRQAHGCGGASGWHVIVCSGRCTTACAIVVEPLHERLPRTPTSPTVPYPSLRRRRYRKRIDGVVA